MAKKIATDDQLQIKVDKIVELQKGIDILKERMQASKEELIEYFGNKPQLKKNRYDKDGFVVRYIDRKTNDSITQRLIVIGLSKYFKSTGVSDANKEIDEILSIIKSLRKSSVKPTIEITNKN